MASAHQNLSMHAGDPRELYRIWDDDLRRCIKKRQWAEFGGFGCLILSSIAYSYGYTTPALWGVYFAVQCLFAAAKYMIDESNTNYLMHQWDLLEAVSQFKRRGQN